MKYFQTMKARLVILLLVPLLIMTGIAVLLIRGNTADTNRLTVLFQETTNRPTSLVLNADRDLYQAWQAFHLYSGAQSKQDFDENVTQAKERVLESYAILQAKSLTELSHPASGRSIQEITDQFNANLDLMVNEAAALMSAGKPSTASAEEAFNNTRGGLNEFGEILDAYSSEQAELIRKENEQVQRWIYAGIAVIFLAVAGGGYWLIRNMSHSINEVLVRTDQAARGDFSMAVIANTTKRDELGQISRSLDAMLLSVRGLIENIISSTTQVAATAQLLSVRSEESAQGAAHAAQSIKEVTQGVETLAGIAEETNRAVNEIAAGVNRIAESTADLSERSAEITQSTDIGLAGMEELHSQIKSVIDKAAALSSVIQSLGTKSEQIGQVADNISQFAAQTNVLSLNASIEASRAGEHGRGFAVVANEIRLLAARSMESAEGITSMIQGTLDEIAAATQYMQQTIEEASKSTQVMDNVQKGFVQIHQTVKTNAEQILETSAVTEQMAASSEEISAGMEHSASTAQAIYSQAQSAAQAASEQEAMIQTVASSSKQLQEVAATLDQSVAKFKLE